MSLWLRCQKSVVIDTPTGRRWRSAIEVSRTQSEIGLAQPYELMCATIGDAIHARYLAAVLEDIRQVELGQVSEIEEETEGWLFWISPAGVRFEGKFDQGSGGQVTLAQFKLAVQTYLQFLQDLERKPVEVVFPEA